MPDLETELRAALHARSDQIDPARLRPLDSRARPRRRLLAPALAAAAIVAVVLALAVAGEFDGPESRHEASVSRLPAATWPLYHSSHGGFSVRYDPSWQPYPADYAGSFIVGIVFLSSQPLPAACTTTHPGGKVEIDCDTVPRVALRPGGVAISWSSGGTMRSAPSVAARLRSEPGHGTTIDGHPAKIAVRAPDRRSGCARTGATTEVDASIATSRSNTTRMTACLRATGYQLAGLERAVIASARSAKL